MFEIVKYFLNHKTGSSKYRETKGRLFLLFSVILKNEYLYFRKGVDYILRKFIKISQLPFSR